MNSREDAALFLKTFKRYKEWVNERVPNFSDMRGFFYSQEDMDKYRKIMEDDHPMNPKNFEYYQAMGVDAILGWVSYEKDPEEFYKVSEKAREDRERRISHDTIDEKALREHFVNLYGEEKANQFVQAEIEKKLIAIENRKKVKEMFIKDGRIKNINLIEQEMQWVNETIDKTIEMYAQVVRKYDIESLGIEDLPFDEQEKRLTEYRKELGEESEELSTREKTNDEAESKESRAEDTKVEIHAEKETKDEKTDLSNDDWKRVFQSSGIDPILESEEELANIDWQKTIDSIGFSEVARKVNFNLLELSMDKYKDNEQVQQKIGNISEKLFELTENLNRQEFREEFSRKKENEEVLTEREEKAAVLTAKVEENKSRKGIFGFFKNRTKSKEGPEK